MGVFASPGRNVVGCPEMDNDHLVMLEILDGLHEAMVQGRGNVLIGETLDALARHEAAHFAREERIMKSCRYPEAEEHRQDHRRMLKELSTLRRRVRAGHMPIAYDTMQTMRRWISEHIHGADRSAAAYVMAQRSTDQFAPHTDKNQRGRVLMAGQEYSGLPGNGQWPSTGVEDT